MTSDVLEPEAGFHALSTGTKLKTRVEKGKHIDPVHACAIPLQFAVPAAR
ncbi:MAG: hypothetical protein OYM47_06030 [Gemmatimonadota bacterium]|nr:hypothetical protein [Gemmatimonadota bacterium]